MAKHFRGEHVSQSAQEEMLGIIQADKAHCRKLIDTIIERMWIELGNCCGLRVQGGNGVQRPLASRNDLRQALKAVTPRQNYTCCCTFYLTMFVMLCTQPP